MLVSLARTLPPSPGDRPPSHRPPAVASVVSSGVGVVTRPSERCRALATFAVQNGRQPWAYGPHTGAINAAGASWPFRNERKAPAHHTETAAPHPRPEHTGGLPHSVILPSAWAARPSPGGGRAGSRALTQAESHLVGTVRPSPNQALKGFCDTLRVRPSSCGDKPCPSRIFSAVFCTRGLSLRSSVFSSKPRLSVTCSGAWGMAHEPAPVPGAGALWLLLPPRSRCLGSGLLAASSRRRRYCRLVILRSLNFTKLFYLQFLKYNLIINGLWNPL